MKVAVCIPAHRDTRARFTLSLAAMVNFTARQQVEYNGETVAPELSFHMVGSARIDHSRQKLADGAMAVDPDYLLWLDDDHTFPRDILFSLAAHDLQIVGCNYSKRVDDEKAVSSAANLSGGEYRNIPSKSEGVEAVDAIGFGVCLIKAQVFKLLPRPWFVSGPYGEDVFFCQQAKAHGIQPYVDHSIKIGHIGETIFEL